MTVSAVPVRPKAILLFNDECAVCRSIGRWVSASAEGTAGRARLVVQPIGDDPDALRSLNPNLDIWAAYETIHILMPNGSMKTGGEAVAQVLRDLPNCRWFAWVFSVGILGIRPFQAFLNLGYLLLSDLRPLLGCESCGMPNSWVKHVAAIVGRLSGTSASKRHPTSSPHAPQT